MLILGAALFGSLLLLARRTRDDGIFLSASVLTCVWIAWSAFITVTEIYEPWFWGIGIDLIAAFVLTIPGSSRNRVILACLYWLQIAFHTAYGWVKITRGLEPYELYTNALDAVALLQIAFVGGWSVADILRRRGGRPVVRSDTDIVGMARRRAEK